MMTLVKPANEFRLENNASEKNNPFNQPVKPNKLSAMLKVIAMMMGDVTNDFNNDFTEVVSVFSWRRIER